MAEDIAALLAGAAKTNANFNFDEIGKAYWAGLEEAYKQKQRNLFKEGAPTDAAGNVDWNAVGAQALQAGGVPALGEALKTGTLLKDIATQRGLQGMGTS